MEGNSVVSEGLPFIYEDNHVLVVNKPAGLLSQGDLSGDLDVLTFAKEIIKKRDKKPGNVFLGLVHRLDRPVGGVMVLAKTSKCASRLSKQFRERTTQKIYYAIVEGIPKTPEAELCHFLKKNTATRITQITGESEGKEARLYYRTVNTYNNRSLLEIRLITGLSHQIRAQLSASGCPIVGDMKYGSLTKFGFGEIALFAKSVSFIHPTTNKNVLIEADLPQTKHWELYSKIFSTRKNL